MTSETSLSTTSGAALRPWLVPTVRPTDLARKAGVSPQYVYAVLAGKKRPSAKIVNAVADLGLPADIIFGTGATTPERNAVDAWPPPARAEGTARSSSSAPHGIQPEPRKGGEAFEMSDASEGR